MNTEKVSDQADRLNFIKSLGPDGVHPRVLKELKREIAEVLAKECNVPSQTATCQRTGSAPAAIEPSGWRATLEGAGTTDQ